MATKDEIIALVDRYVEAFNTSDREAYVALFVEDGTVEDPVGSGVHQGPAAIGAFWDAVHGLSSSLELVLTGSTRVAGNGVAFTMQAISTVGEDRIVVDIIDVFEVSDDARIVSMRAYWDMAEMRPFNTDA